MYLFFPSIYFLFLLCCFFFFFFFTWFDVRSFGSYFSLSKCFAQQIDTHCFKCFAFCLLLEFFWRWQNQSIPFDHNIEDVSTLYFWCVCGFYCNAMDAVVDCTLAQMTSRYCSITNLYIRDVCTLVYECVFAKRSVAGWFFFFI